MRNLGWRLHRWASDRRLLSWQFMYILNRCCNKERGEEKQGVQGFKILWLVLVEGGGVMTTWDEEISEKCTPVLFQWLPVLLCLFVVVFFLVFPLWVPVIITVGIVFYPSFSLFSLTLAPVLHYTIALSVACSKHVYFLCFGWAR